MGEFTATSAHEALEQLVEHLAHLLPSQGPIGVFIHHNTLHAFEDRPFDEAVVEAAAIYGAEPYMTLAAFEDAFARGRIRPADLDAVVADDDAAVAPGVTRRALHRALLHPGVPPLDPATIGWQLEEGALAKAYAADPEGRARFAACLARTVLDDTAPSQDVRPDVGVDIDPLLIRLCAAFVDQGQSYWPMPGRDRGFLAAARDLLALRHVPLPAALTGLDRACAWQRARGADAATVVLECLERQGIDEGAWAPVLQRELLALPGWAGLFHTLEHTPGLAPHVAVPCRLMDYLAVRLTLATQASWFRRHEPPAVPTVAPRQVRAVRAVTLAHAAGLVGISAAALLALDERAWQAFAGEVERFDSVQRRQLWQQAYERQHEDEVLGALASHRRHTPPAALDVVSAQVFFCIDEREESMRRAVEEVDPTIETLGAAGFFGIAVQYQALDDPHGVPLCPVVVTPQHAVTERAHADDAAAHETRVARRRVLGRLARTAAVSSRTLVRGWVSTAVLGLLAGVPLIGRVLTPRAFGRLREQLNDAFLPVPRTELLLMRDDAATHARVEGLLQGFSVEEKADRVGGVLAQAGLTQGFAPLVVVLGHGSTSLNNPHESAHDCGACGGRRGGANARLFAAMANHPAVRALLRARGIALTDATWVVGGYHDTCSDDVELFDLDAVPAGHRAALAAIRQTLDEARARNAHERARRFESCAAGITAAAALVHVETRAEHLAQPRPEYGHGTNAVCVVGRRATTRGLFLDRRSFLVSYDAATDPDDALLGRLLGAALPVCAGISLEYYFSFVDNERYGCGTKLPHNVTGLVGVMNGQGSDLRTGLPWQMVEIHEPVRILFVVETTPARLGAVLSANPALDRLVRHHWVRISTMDPATGELHVWRGTGWQRRDEAIAPLPQAASSRAWYEGHLAHLPPAWIRPGAAAGRPEARA